ncbi:MAG TPA: phage holin family protein, partial [Nocardioides sp.]|nr:phage holin family protein [Nocardioides sp.]
MSTSTPGHTSHTVQDDPPLGALVHDLTRQVPQLIRSEIRLAQAELTEKGKRAGLGVGMFSAAGLLAFLG